MRYADCRTAVRKLSNCGAQMINLQGQNLVKFIEHYKRKILMIAIRPLMSGPDSDL